HTRSVDRARVPGAAPPALADDDRECRLPPRARGLAARSARGPCSRDARPRRSPRRRRPAAPPSVGRHASADGSRARPRAVSSGASPRRAVQRARRPDPRAPQCRAPGDLDRDRHDHRPRDARHPRGGLPRRSDCRPGQPTRPPRRGGRSPVASTAPACRPRCVRSLVRRGPRSSSSRRRRGRHEMSGRRLFADAAPVVAAAAIFVLAWKALVVVGNWQPFVLPAPETVGARFVRAWTDGTMAPHAATTLVEIALGLAVGAGTALLVGYLLARSPLAERLFSPYIVAAQSTPVLALAPLFALWFGTGLLSKVLMCAIIVFF